MLTQVLQIKPSSGTVKASEVSNIVIKFMPSRQDNFSQFFELSIAFENGLNQKCTFKVCAKVSIFVYLHILEIYIECSILDDIFIAFSNCSLLHLRALT